MIITRVYGGLGNQLFMYYAGLGMAHLLNRRCQVDMATTILPNRRPYALEDFGLGKGINIDDQEVIISIFKVAETYRRTSLEQHAGKKLYGAIQEKSGSYYSEECLQVAKETCVCLIDGFWHSWKYFHHLPIREFSKLKMSTESSERYFQEIVRPGNRNVESYVAIHVRRGDMKPFQAVFQPAGFPYFQEAIAFISTKIENPRFVIFSDEWDGLIFEQLNCLLGERAIMVKSKELSDWDTFRLMAKFKSHIIANSTFSWWAAYLAQILNPGYLWTIAPDQWNANRELDNRDLIPAHWIRIRRVGS